MAHIENDEQFLELMLRSLDLKQNEEKIVRAIMSGQRTTKDITGFTKIQRSHVHSYLGQLVERGLLEKEESGPRRGKANIYNISIQGFLKIARDRSIKLRSQLRHAEDFEGALERLAAEKTEEPPFRAAKPEILETTSMVHAKIVDLFSKYKNLIVSTRAPFLWMGNFHGSENIKPFPGTEDFWKTQMDFLQKSIDDKTFKLTYFVDIEGYIEILRKRKAENERIQCIHAIMECVRGLDKGWNLKFIERSHEGLRFAQQAFAVCGEDGYFVMGVVDLGDVVEKGIFFQSPTLADFLTQNEAFQINHRTARSNLIRFAQRIVNETVLPPKVKNRLRDQLKKIEDKETN